MSLTRLLPLLLLAACAGGAHRSASDAPPPPPDPLEFDTDTADLVGLKLRLTESTRPTVSSPSTPLPDAKVLSDDRVAQLIERLPDMQRAERAAFKLREDSKPPPLTGDDVHSAFPPLPTDAAPPSASGSSLQVLRYAPEGDVPMAPHVSVTFSQPMVAVTSQDEASKTTPVTMDPQPPGAWRWIGTKTVLFDPEPRLPMATEFTFTVPKGTRSALDGALTEDTTWTLRTPPVKVTTWYPNSGRNPVDTPLFLEFNQRVDDAILEHVTLRKGSTDMAVRAATQAQIDADEVVKGLVDAAEPGRFVVLMPQEPLTPASNYSFIVKKGAPSAEGPRLTGAPQTRTFRTYDPLKVDEVGCSMNKGACDPDGGLYIRFNNALADTQTEHIRLEPPVDGVRVQGNRRWFSLAGPLPPRSKVTLVIDAEATDKFGQTLGKEYRHTYNIGPANQRLRGPGREQLVLDPVGPRVMPIYSRNHKELDVQVFKVTTSNYAAVSKWVRDNRYDGYLAKPPAPRSARRRIKVTAYKDDELVETAIDLSEWLDDEGHGQVVVWVQPTVQPKQRWQRTDVLTWVQATDLGVTAFVEQGNIMAWVTRLRDGVAVPGAQVQLLGQQGSTTTDESGLAILGKYKKNQGPHALIATLKGDVALLPSQGQSWWNQTGQWAQLGTAVTTRWFVFDDRGMYKPSEKVHIKGYVRPLSALPGGGLRPWPNQTPALQFKVRDPQGQILTQGTGTISDSGSFDVDFELPKTPNLGSAQLILTTTRMGVEQRHVHRFQIQEFRRPEFEVTASVDPRPYVLGENATATVRAGYYAGGPLPAAPVTWSVSASPATFTPAGWPGYSFASHGAVGWGGLGFGRGGRPGGSGQRWSLQGQTDASGEHHAKLSFLAMAPPRPTTVTAEATVIDVNRQRWTSSTTMLVHPSDQYVGLKTDRGFYEKGKQVQVQMVVVDLDGVVRDGVTIDMVAAQLRWKRKDGVYQEVEVSRTECAKTSADKPVVCAFTPDQGGSWRLTATAVDSEGRATQTQRRLWVSGGKQPPQRSVAMQEVKLIPSKDTYAPGDTAEVLVIAPFVPAEGVWTLRRHGRVHTARFRMTESSTTLRLPITDEHVPNIFLEVDLVGSSPRLDDDDEPMHDKPGQVAYASGVTNLRVPPISRTLTVSVTPETSAVAPGASTSVKISVRDAQGAPVQAEVALVIVDEAVLALSNYQTPDPIAVFYPYEPSGVSEVHSRAMVVLADPKAVDDAAPESEFGELLEVSGGLIGTSTGIGGLGSRGYGSGGGGSARGRGAGPPSVTEYAKQRTPAKGKHDSDRLRREQPPAPPSTSTSPVALRENFRALALFSPHVMTDAGGDASVSIELPDSLTRYRVMAVAIDNTVKFGAGESTLTARKALMLRPSPPRFLNFGDKAEIPFVVQNPTDQAVTVDVVIRVDNGQVLPDINAQPSASAVLTAGRQVQVPAGDRVEVRFPVAASLAGTARFQALAVGADGTDAATFEFPVWTPATTEAFATYGEIDEGAIVQPVQAPPNVVPQFGGLQVTTSSTELQALTDALLYLNQYPYECSEQIASRTLANAALKDVLEAFEAQQLPSADEMRASVTADMQRLQRRQLSHGGFAYWGASRAWPYPSVHAAHAIVRAREKGFEPSKDMEQRAMVYLVNIEQHIPSYYSQRSRYSIIAYAVYVRYLAGDVDGAKARWLYRRGLDRLSFEAQGWILPVLHKAGATAEVDAIFRNLENKVTQTASTAEFAEFYTDDNDYVLLHGARRTDAVLLDAFVQVRPKHDLVPKLVRGLLGHRTRGRWSTTQENSFVLLAMDRYFRVLEAKEPDFVARVWLGDGYAGDHTFKGRTTERSHIDVPMAWLTDPGGTQNLTIAKEGPGRLYYRIGMRYAPSDLKLEPADHGFAVERVYEGIDDPSDVTRLDDGTWQIRSGARIRVRLTMVAPARRTHVALVDPLPGGFEAQNPSLSVTGSLPEDPNRPASPYWWWRSAWYTHQNLRDERAEAFTELLWAGVHTYSYVAIASTPGQYIVPPTKAEEMYHPETFGRSGTDRVVIR